MPLARHARPDGDRLGEQPWARATRTPGSASRPARPPSSASSRRCAPPSAPRSSATSAGSAGCSRSPSTATPTRSSCRSTDGVGTKALIAQATGRFDTIGVDLVAMCVDDIVCQGAEPLFFLDYIAVGKLDPDHIEQLVEGVAHGCRQAGCALIGGEMAEHPGAMDPGEFDLVGFAVGVVERDRLITGEHVQRGDVLIGLPSPGLRSNGYSLARKVLLESAGRDLHDPAWSGAPPQPRRRAARAVGRLRARHRGAAPPRRRAGHRPHHRRRAPRQPRARAARRRATRASTRGTWEAPRIFGEIQRLGEVSDDEMRKVFNLGIGMVVVVAADEVHRTLDLLRTEGHRAVRDRARSSAGHGQVRFELSVAMTVGPRRPRRPPARAQRAHRRLHPEERQAELVVHRRQADDLPGRRHAARRRRRARGHPRRRHGDRRAHDGRRRGGLRHRGHRRHPRAGSCAASACARRSRTTAAAAASPARWSPATGW